MSRVCAAGGTASAAPDLPRPCHMTPGYDAQMDDLAFWLGSWDCTWDGGHGTNDVTLELDDHVIVERFESLAPERFTGLSVSVPAPSGEGWRQTWVDSSGSYWHFVGGPQADGTFIFGTPEPVDADRLFKRMVFSEITGSGFAWRWEASADGIAWEQRWAITYRPRDAA